MRRRTAITLVSGGLKEVGYRTMMSKNPEKALELAVKGMLPKSPSDVRCSENFMFLQVQSTISQRRSRKFTL